MPKKHSELTKAQGRNLVVRSRSVRARLQEITPRGQEPTAPSGPDSGRCTIGGLHDSTYCVHEAATLAGEVRLSAIDRPKVPPVKQAAKHDLSHTQGLSTSPATAHRGKVAGRKVFGYIIVLNAAALSFQLGVQPGHRVHCASRSLW